MEIYSISVESSRPTIGEDAFLIKSQQGFVELLFVHSEGKPKSNSLTFSESEFSAFGFFYSDLQETKQDISQERKN